MIILSFRKFRRKKERERKREGEDFISLIFLDTEFSSVSIKQSCTYPSKEMQILIVCSTDIFRFIGLFFRGFIQIIT